MTRIRILKPCPTEVLIYDEIGVTYLKEAIPFGVKTIVFPVRDKIPVILKYRFFINFIKNSLRHRFRLRLAYLLACIEEFEPKVVISFADNNVVLGEYARVMPSVSVISVQNALRSELALKNRIRYAPTYMALGDATKELFKKTGIGYQEVLSVGSLPLGIFLSRSEPALVRHQIGFVSSFRAHFLTSRDPYSIAQLRVHESLFTCLMRYCLERNLRLTVIAKGKVKKDGEHYIEEKKYFERLADGNPFCFSSTAKGTFKSYQIALNCDLLVAVDSTLAYEALSVGRRVLFGWKLVDALVEAGEFYTQHLPKEMLLTSNDFNHFSAKADLVRRMDEQKYNRLIQSAQSVYVNQSLTNPPHHRLKEKIANHLRRPKM